MEINNIPLNLIQTAKKAVGDDIIDKQEYTKIINTALADGVIDENEKIFIANLDNKDLIKQLYSKDFNAPDFNVNQFSFNVNPTDKSLTIGTVIGETGEKNGNSGGQTIDIKTSEEGNNNLENITLSKMDSEKFSNMSFEQKQDWYNSKLSPILPDLINSAKKNNIPVELLSTVITNELADIGNVDLVQESYLSKGSLGIAQIQVQTAIDHKLIDVSEDEINNYIKDNSVIKNATKEEAVKEITANKLKNPSLAVEASAREIKIILNKALASPNSKWAQNFLKLPVTKEINNMDDLMNNVKGANNREKLLNLSKLVTSIYNSPDILIAENPGHETYDQYSKEKQPYKNAKLHGSNAYLIMTDILNMSNQLGLPKTPEAVQKEIKVEQKPIEIHWR